MIIYDRLRSGWVGGKKKKPWGGDGSSGKWWRGGLDAASAVVMDP